MKHNCDLCSADDPRPIEAARPFIGDNEPPVVCGNCGFCYVSERRTSEQVANAWSDIFGDGYTSAWPAVKARLTYVAEWIDQNIGLEGKSVLDIGAGEGTFLKIADGMGASGVGIEPCFRNTLSMKEANTTCFYGTVEQAAESQRFGKLFDIVTVNWTLENTGDCIGFLKKAREFLKPDGHLVVATGSRIGVPFKKPLSKYFSTNPADTHCFRFSYGSLVSALFSVDFDCVDNNQYDDSDWLVLCASGDSGGRNQGRHFKDNPDEVLQFFNDWARMWP